LESPSPTVANDATIAPFLHDGLLRHAALEADLVSLVGETWREEHPPVPATDRYVARLQEVGTDWPGGHIAHHYTRYMGDLSGGQIIGRRAAATYGLEEKVNDNFARFDQIGDLDRFKDSY